MDIIDYLPQKMKAEAEAYMPCGLEEIRVRAGKQVQYMLSLIHIFGAAIAIKEVMKDYPFKLVIYGTPAEDVYKRQLENEPKYSIGGNFWCIKVGQIV